MIRLFIYDLEIDLDNLRDITVNKFFKKVYFLVSVQIKMATKKGNLIAMDIRRIYMKMVQILYNLKIATTTEAPRLNGIYL